MAKLHEALVRRLGEKADTLTAAEARVLRSAFDYRVRAKGIDSEQAAESVLVEKGYILPVAAPAKKAEYQTVQAVDAFSSVIGWARLFGSIIVVLVAGGWLTTDAARALGGGYENWIRAALVEVVGFACLVVPVRSWINTAAVRSLGVAAVVLAFTTIHQGIAQDADSAIRGFVAADYRVQSLRDKHDRIAQTIKALPASYVTKRKALESEADTVLASLDSAESQAVSGSSGIEGQARVNTWFRLFLIAVNVVFGHAVVHAIRNQRKGIEFVMQKKQLV
jgi:hypothetical protein